MKQLILFIACLGALVSKAQLINSPYDFKSLNEEQFHAVFGSVSGYNMEAGYELNSAHHRLVMLIGARLWWLQEVTKYMVEQLGCDRNVDSDNDPIHGHFAVHPGMTIGDDDASPVDIQAYTDDSLHLTKVVMKGNTSLLIKLFVYYWYRDEIKFDIKKFKKGCLFYENCGSDRISFNWKGTKPNITITKNPTFPIPIPTIAERKWDK